MYASTAVLTASSTPGWPLAAGFVPESEQAIKPSATVTVNNRTACLLFIASSTLLRDGSPRPGDIVLYCVTCTAGGCHVPSPGGRMDGGSVFGEYSFMPM